MLPLDGVGYHMGDVPLLLIVLGCHCFRTGLHSHEKQRYLGRRMSEARSLMLLNRSSFLYVTAAGQGRRVSEARSLLLLNRSSFCCRTGYQLFFQA